MKRWLRHGALVSACALAAGSWLASGVEPSVAGPSAAQDVDWSQAPAVAFVATPPQGDTSSVYLVEAGESLPPAVAQLEHLPGASLRAELLPGGEHLAVTARVIERGDATFDSALFAVDLATGQVRPLCREVVHASRPLIAGDGRLFVARGAAGSQPSPTQLRVDTFSIDEVSWGNGAVHSWHSYDGYLAHLAGWYQGELLVYRVGPEGADIVAVDASSAKTRVLIASLPPFARDFSVDGAGGRLVFRGRHETDSQRWVVDAVKIGSGARSRLYEEDGGFALAPYAWPGGGLAVNQWRRGLVLLGSDDPVSRPLGPGVDLVRDVSSDGSFVASLHSEQGKLPVPYLIDRDSGGFRLLPMPAGERVAVAGFVSQGGAP